MWFFFLAHHKWPSVSFPHFQNLTLPAFFWLIALICLFVLSVFFKFFWKNFFCQLGFNNVSDWRIKKLNLHLYFYFQRMVLLFPKAQGQTIFICICGHLLNKFLAQFLIDWVWNIIGNPRRLLSSNSIDFNYYFFRLWFIVESLFWKRFSISSSWIQNFSFKKFF